MPTEGDKPKEHVIENIIKACKKIMLDNNIPETEIEYIGLGIPGTCDYDTGSVVLAPNINGFKNLPLRDLIREHINLPIYVENDANCAALAEGTFGAARGYKNSLTITLGTGIGGGFIINSQLVKGDTEVGHHIIAQEEWAPMCGCGYRGCFEAHASATALIEMLKKLWKTHMRAAPRAKC